MGEQAFNAPAYAGAATIQDGADVGPDPATLQRLVTEYVEKARNAGRSAEIDAEVRAIQRSGMTGGNHG